MGNRQDLSQRGKPQFTAEAMNFQNKGLLYHRRSLSYPPRLVEGQQEFVA
jgi:hypothetical protein